MGNNHGDRKSPNWGYSPSKWPFHGLYMGVTNHLLTGKILQVVGGEGIDTHGSGSGGGGDGGFNNSKGFLDPHFSEAFYLLPIQPGRA